MSEGAHAQTFPEPPGGGMYVQLQGGGWGIRDPAGNVRPLATREPQESHPSIDPVASMAAGHPVETQTTTTGPGNILGYQPAPRTAPNPSPAAPASAPALSPTESVTGPMPAYLSGAIQHNDAYLKMLTSGQGNFRNNSPQAIALRQSIQAKAAAQHEMWKSMFDQRGISPQQYEEMQEGIINQLQDDIADNYGAFMTGGSPAVGRGSSRCPRLVNI